VHATIEICLLLLCIQRKLCSSFAIAEQQQYSRTCWVIVNGDGVQQLGSAQQRATHVLRYTLALQDQERHVTAVRQASSTRLLITAAVTNRVTVMLLQQGSLPKAKPSFMPGCFPEPSTTQSSNCTSKICCCNSSTEVLSRTWGFAAAAASPPEHPHPGHHHQSTQAPAAHMQSRHRCYSGTEHSSRVCLKTHGSSIHTTSCM
jgi:hypothetical protein